ncbi:MFS transporter [Microbacterium sp. PMB16]|uniref:MFS transporter n=1 Tax=Microbacterium sp. PMB16 TaxID=3120157 RepID=UPI003F4C3CD6
MTRSQLSVDSTTAATVGRPAPTALQRRVLFGGGLGQFIEFYDLTLYGLTALVFAQQFFPGETIGGLLAAFATFGVAFAVRPLGGLFFGALGDRIGRRRVLTITLFLVGGATAAMGLLPTFDAIGWFAPALLVLLRLLQGLSAGGETVGGPSFVFEHAPADRRGRWVNFTLAATALPSVVAGGLIVLISTVVGNEAYLEWGWRLPFLLALPLALVGVWIRSRTEESEMFTAEVATHDEEFSPVKEAFRTNWRKMLQVIFIVGLTAMGFYFLSTYFVSYIQTAGNLSRELALLTNAGAMCLYAILLPIGGAIGDRVGRRPMLIAGAVAMAVVSIPAFSLVTSGVVGLALLGQALFVVPLCVYGGGCYTFFVEIFSTRTRFTSAAISYNGAYALFGGTAPFVGTALVDATGSNVAPGYYVAAAAVIVFVLILVTRVPETRGRVG